MTSQDNNRADNQTKKDSEESDLEYLSRPTIIPDNQADWLDDILFTIETEYLKTESNKTNHQIRKEAKAAITTKIAEERIEEMKKIKQEYLLDNSYQAVVIYAANRIVELKAGLGGEEK